MEDVALGLRKLLMALYGTATEQSSFSSLEEISAHKFLNNASAALKLLPPEDGFHLHL